MPRANLSLPHERRKAKLKSRQISLKVRQAEGKEALKQINAELSAMKPRPPSKDTF